MDKTTFSFAAADGSETAVYRWSSDGAPKATVQIAHGTGEHAASTSSRRASTVSRTHVG
jgi:alpha-beta hydrolase superfamily lysophospholipase